jgi:hypothetical protein
LKFADAEAGIFNKASITETSGYSVLLKRGRPLGIFETTAMVLPS